MKKDVNKKEKEVLEKMATASFNKEFVIRDKKVAQKIVKALESPHSTLKRSKSAININAELSRSGELLNQFRSR